MKIYQLLPMMLFLVSVGVGAAPDPADDLAVTSLGSSMISICFTQTDTAYGPLRANMVQLLHDAVFNTRAIIRDTSLDLDVFTAQGNPVSLEDPSEGVGANGVGGTGQQICTTVMVVADGTYRIAHASLDNCPNGRRRCDVSPLVIKVIEMTDVDPTGNVTLTWDPVSDDRIDHYVVEWGLASGAYDNEQIVPGDQVITTILSVPFGAIYVAVKACDAGQTICSSFSNEVGVNVL